MEDSEEGGSRFKPPELDVDKALDQMLRDYSKAFHAQNPLGKESTLADRQEHAEVARRSFGDLLSLYGKRCSIIAADTKRLEAIYQEAAGKEAGMRAGIAFLTRPVARADRDIADQRIRRLTWTEMDPTAVGSKLRSRIKELEALPGRPGVSARIATMPFYPESRVIHIFMKEYDTTDAILWSGDAFAIETPAPDKDLVLLDWSNGPIYQLNREGYLRISGVAESYLRFFFHLVRGRHGRFLVLETEDDLNELVTWKDARSPADAEKKAIAAKLCRQIALREIDADGRLVYRVTMLFRDSMVEVDVTVDGNGLVDMGTPDWLPEGQDLAVQWEG